VDYAVELFGQNRAFGELIRSGEPSIWQNWLGRTPF
jgi:hypothetical protein